MAEGKAAVTPGVREKEGSAENGENLGAPDARWFLGLLAKLNFVAQDGPGAQYAAKEVCCKMGSPTIGTLRKLKRLARYLRGAARMRPCYKRQRESRAS